MGGMTRVSYSRPCISVSAARTKIRLGQLHQSTDSVRFGLLRPQVFSHILLLIIATDRSERVGA